MTDSIFLTVKKMLGIAEEYHAFDLDIIININSVFLTLNQLGVGPVEPYQITGEEETWNDFQGDVTIPGLQTYVYLKTRLAFDPPTNSFLVDNIQKQIAELEWRMNVQVETPMSKISNRDDISTYQSKVASPIHTTPYTEIIRQKIVSTLNTQSCMEGGVRDDRSKCFEESTYYY